MAKKGKSGFIGSKLSSRGKANAGLNPKGMPGHCGQAKAKPIIPKGGGKK